MYYIAVSSIGRVGIGESVLLGKDILFDELSVTRPSGEVVGFVSSLGIEGCITKDYLRRITHETRAIACEVLLKSGDVLILATDGRYTNVSDNDCNHTPIRQLRVN